MTALRVTLVGPYPPPFGGIASHLSTLIPGLLARGVEDIAVVCFGSVESTEMVDGAAIYRVNAAARFRRLAVSHLASLLLAAARIRHWRLPARRLVVESVRARVVDEVVNRHRSNVVSFYQSDDSIALAALRPIWGKRRGVVLTVFGEVLDHMQFLSPRRGALAALLSSADALLSSSKHCAHSFTQLGIANEIEPLYYGVDLDRFGNARGDEARRRLSIPEDAIIALYMGRFEAEMGVGSVLDAAPNLFARLPNLFLVLAGAPGPLSARAHEIVIASGGRLIIHENVSFDFQPTLYAAADIVLAPTRDQHACMGMSIKEAMATGRATIGSMSGGIPEAIAPNLTGMLVALGIGGGVDQAMFEESIVALATDHTRRQAMGRAARARAESMFSAEKTIDRFLEVMKSVAPSA